MKEGKTMEVEKTVLEGASGWLDSGGLWWELRQSWMGDASDGRKCYRFNI